MALSAMNLSDQLEALEPLRLLREPAADQPLCAIILARDLARLPAWLEKRQHLQLKLVVVADAPAGIEVSGHLPPALRQARFSGGIPALTEACGCASVFLFMPEVFIRVICMNVPRLRRETVYIPASQDAALACRAPLPQYYQENAQELEKVWGLLHGPEDREIFARRVKTLVSGDPGYQLLSPFPEYEYPELALEPGDVLIDGGLSDMVDAQKSFAAKVGKDGQVHGFEPIAWMAQKAAQELKPWPWYQVHALGLADREGTARFACLRDSSHLAPEAQDGEECRLTSIDSFAKAAALPRVNAIKLDVEGAELLALRGGAGLISASRPRLMICLYHKPRDLFEIPLFIHELAPQYQLRLGHSSCGFTDTILYAKV